MCSNYCASILIASAERREVMFYPCLSVRPPATLLSYERILVKFFGGVERGPRNNRLNFGGDPDDPDPAFLGHNPGSEYSSLCPFHYCRFRQRDISLLSSSKKTLLTPSLPSRQTQGTWTQSLQNGEPPRLLSFSVL